MSPLALDRHPPSEPLGCFDLRGRTTDNEHTRNSMDELAEASTVVGSPPWARKKGQEKGVSPENRLETFCRLCHDIQKIHFPAFKTTFRASSTSHTRLMNVNEEHLAESLRAKKVYLMENMADIYTDITLEALAVFVMELDEDLLATTVLHKPLSKHADGRPIPRYEKVTDELGIQMCLIDFLLYVTEIADNLRFGRASVGMRECAKLTATLGRAPEGMEGMKHDINIKMSGMELDDEEGETTKERQASRDAKLEAMNPAQRRLHAVTERVLLAQGEGGWDGTTATGEAKRHVEGIVSDETGEETRQQEGDAADALAWMGLDKMARSSFDLPQPSKSRDPPKRQRQRHLTASQKPVNGFRWAAPTQRLSNDYDDPLLGSTPSKIAPVIATTDQGPNSRPSTPAGVKRGRDEGESEGLAASASKRARTSQQETGPGPASVLPKGNIVDFVNQSVFQAICHGVVNFFLTCGPYFYFAIRDKETVYLSPLQTPKARRYGLPTDPPLVLALAAVGMVLASVDFTLARAEALQREGEASAEGSSGDRGDGLGVPYGPGEGAADESTTSRRDAGGDSRDGGRSGRTKGSGGPSGSSAGGAGPTGNVGSSKWRTQMKEISTALGEFGGRLWLDFHVFDTPSPRLFKPTPHARPAPVAGLPTPSSTVSSSQSTGLDLLLHGFKPLASGNQHLVLEGDICWSDGSSTGMPIVLKQYIAGAKRQVDESAAYDKLAGIEGLPQLCAELWSEDKRQCLRVLSHEGESLEDLGRRVTQDKSASFVRILKDIHSRGVVHQDISRRNLLIGINGPCIVDFDHALTEAAAGLLGLPFAELKEQDLVDLRHVLGRS